MVVCLFQNTYLSFITSIMKHIILFILVLLLTVGQSASNKKTAVLDVKKVDIQPNKNLTFNIKDLSPAKAFMLNIQPEHQKSTFNPFTVSITNKDGKSESCKFTHTNNLCVFEKPAKQVSVVISCLQKRCQSSIVFSQRILVQSGQVMDFRRKLTVPGEIYQLNQRKFNSILEIYSKKEEYQVLSQQIMIYSNVHVFSLQQTHELDASTAIFGIKPISEKTQDQYFFIDNKSNKQQTLAFSIKSHSAQLRDGITVVDFIQNYGKHSGSNYTYVGSLSKNLQTKVRVFSPKDCKDIPLTFSVKGRVDQKSEQKLIREIKFKPLQFDGHNFFDFIFAITHAVHKPYKFISLLMHLGQVQDKSIFFQIGVRDVDSYQTNIFEQVYFGCDAGEILHFTVEPQVKLQLSSGDKDIQILTNSQDNYFSNIQSCSLHKGCSIEITAKSVCQHCKLAFELKDQDVKNHVIYYEVKGDTIEGKVEMQEEIFFKYSMNSKSASQIVVNTANVIIYANFQNYQRCKIPSAACHQYAINQQNPMVVHNTRDKPTQLVFGVFGLEKTSFKVRFINETNGLQVKLGEKFSYLMDDEEKDLQLKFVLDEKALKPEDNLHFNLISPLHSLKLTVANNDGQNFQSLQGYVTFDRRIIHSELFSITIQKMGRYFDQFVHFTLLVTTSDMALRLDPTITHYEKYLPKASKTFLVEYDPSQVNALNIYTENLQKEKATMSLQIIEPSDEEGEKGKVVATHKLMRDNEFIDLDADLQKLDICDDNCELEITITNEGKGQFEQSLTLLTEKSIIGLEDSIWGIFEINEVSRTNHFYFTPRNKGQPISILFNTDDAMLSLDYRIFNTTHSINPQHWPFGHQQQTEKDKQKSHSSNSQEILIAADDAELIACWPTCVILISIRDSRPQDEKNKQTDHSVLKSYKILASNNILELLQDTKLQFSLKNEEQKVLFIQAFNILKYEKLTFFSYYSTGRAKITASVVSNDKQFKLKGQKDFVFSQLETEIPTYLIATTIEQNLLKVESALLKITIKAQSNLKMTLEYTSLLKDIYRLRMDELEVATLIKGQQTLYDFMPQRDFILKLYRSKGFPLFKVFKCNEDNYAECLSNQKQLLETGTVDFLETEERVKQTKDRIEVQDIVANEDLYGNNTYPFEVFVEKSYEFIDEQCEKCVFFLWIYCFEGDLELSINLRSSSSEIELKENKVLNERVIQGQYNKYLVSVSNDKDTIISVNILEGAAKVVISDASGTIQLKQLNSADDKYKMFTINPDKDEEQDTEEEVDEFGTVRNSNERKFFKHLHVTVTGKSQQATQYIISYSVGSSKLYLQDGIVVQQNLVPEIPHTFLYRNHNKKQHAYLTLSSQLLEDYAIVNAKNSLQVKFYYYPDASDRSKKQTFQPELPPGRNENYLGATVTHVYELPSKYELYEVQVQSSSYLKVTASINHQQLVYLPLGFEYLIKLHPGQFLNLAVDSPTSEYLEVKVKKCDDSMPTLMYTNDAKQFKQGIFEAEVDIDRSNFRQYIKTKKSSKTLHLRLIAEQQSESLLAISVAGSSRLQKQQKSAYKAGNKGIIDYKVIQTDTVEVYFKPAACGSKCTAKFEYFLAISQTMQKIYEQLNCANKFFVPQAKKLLSNVFKTDLIPISDKNFRKESGEYHHKVKLSSKQAFIGVKAVSDTEEVFYTPVQIRSFWGELAKASVGIFVMGCLACALVLTVVIAVSTKLARRGYKPISGDE